MNRTVLALGCAALAAGCASETLIRTMPPGAKVTINERFVGITPLTYEVRKYDWPQDNRFRYHMERSGCLPKDGEFEGHVSPGTIVRSVFLSGGLSLLWNNTMVFPDEIYVDLEPAGAVTSGASGVTAAERLRRVTDLYAQGLITEQEYKRARADIIDNP